MWLLYAVAFLLGAGILLVQILSGHDGHDVAGGDDLVADAGAHHPTEGPGLMSMRSMSYGLFAFGFVGGTLHVLGLTSANVALALGLVAGAAATLLVGMTFRELGDPAVSGEAGFHDARGASGRSRARAASRSDTSSSSVPSIPSRWRAPSRTPRVSSGR